MRMDTTTGLTASDLCAQMSEKELADLLYQFGDERLARWIAREIVARRASNPIKTTKDLSDIVCAVYARKK